MEKGRAGIVLLETLALSLIIAGINLIFPRFPGFSNLYYIPYIGASLLLSAVYGAAWGFVSILFSAGLILGPLPFLLRLIDPSTNLSSYWPNIFKSAYIPLPIGLLSSYVFGMIRSASVGTQQQLRGRIETLSRENWLMKKKGDSLMRVNTELDERVSRQQESITTLFTQLKKLDTLDVTEALNILLETVTIFTKAEKASIWRFEENQLVLATSLGWNSNERSNTTLPIESTIEGWVFRNNSIFSVRMLLQYDMLQKMDTGRNLITLPLTFDRKIWGVLNIQEMPFEKYNLYSERLLQIIVRLTEHSIERALAYESIIQQDEVDDRTGLPLFSQFYRLLEEETQRTGGQKGNFGTIIIEITNYAKIIQDHHQDGAKDLVKSIAAELKTLSDNKADFFHYKEDSQIAFIYPGLDFDGVSLFCLETLEKVNGGNWEIDGQRVELEVIIGFSVFSGEGQTSNQLLEQAENLLEMQKV